ncbi:MAG: bifunctional demethylmenaquinone methyltransferase/2-methoxy-6-polyprenyl-1,4-benzoquinol methylase UbiE [Campylobacteraceae bacterium]|nr:bifunctional demethylmenaquinone methyltransferase/2-methoxy-6-polyprenyl-1,4-benzoquinol methylase UbiE [Campylobacteraceae bacterium]
MVNQNKIIEMFNQIAPTYDRANRLISFGIDMSWRKEAVSTILAKFINKDLSIADVACGTGDMMKLWSDMSKGYNANLTRLVGIDPSKGMLDVAREKHKDFEFILGNAGHTTLEDKSMDVVSISYGIRNVVERVKGLEEFNRVLKVDGYLVVLEFARPKKSGLIGRARDFYISNILPKIGGMVSKNKEAYEYLPNSIDGFLDKESFIKELKNSGFEVELAKSYSFDVSTLFVAKKVRDL